jgi:hypothetical protein
VDPAITGDKKYLPKTGISEKDWGSPAEQGEPKPCRLRNEKRYAPLPDMASLSFSGGEQQ